MTDCTHTTHRGLRILMIAPTSFFADYGCHVRIFEEVSALTASGHQVVICTYHNGNNVPGLFIRRTVDVPWRKRVIVGSSRHKLYLDAVLSFTAFRTALSFKPDVIHAHLHEGALIGAAVARALRKPLVFDYQGSLTEEMLDHGFVSEQGRIIPWLRRLERRIDKLPNLTLTSSENARQRLDMFRPKQHTRTMLDAVDTTRFSPTSVTEPERTALKQHLGIPVDSKVVVYLGLLAPYQGTDVLLEAAEMVARSEPSTFFLLMGFPSVDRYQQIAAQRGLANRVSLPGRIPYFDAHRYLAVGDVAVAPKMSLTEGNGKIYNYMSMGLPVVAFDAAPNREILGDAGVYARHGDADDLAAKLIDVLRDSRRARVIGDKLRRRAVDAMSWSDRINDLIGVYARVLDRSLDPGEAIRFDHADREYKSSDD